MRANNFSQLVRGAQETARRSPGAASSSHLPKSPIKSSTPSHRSPLAHDTSILSKFTSSGKSEGASRGSSTRRGSGIGALGAALTDAWLTGRVRGGDSPQYAANVLAADTSLWLGPDAADAEIDGFDLPKPAQHVHQPQLVWTSVASHQGLGRGRRAVVRDTGRNTSSVSRCS